MPRAFLLHLVQPWEPCRESVASAVLDRDTGGSDGLLAACAVATSHPAWRHRVVVLGSASSEARAAHLRINSTDRVAAPLGSPRLAGPGLSAWLSGRRRPDAVVAWNAALVAPAERLMPPGVPVIRGELIAEAAAPVWKSPADKGPSLRCDLLHELGLPANEAALVIGLLADRPREADLRAFAFTMGLLAVAHLRVIGLAPAHAAHAVRAARLRRTIGLNWPLVITERPVLSLLGALDAAVLGSADPGSTGVRVLVASAHSAGVPVFAHERIAPRGLYPDQTLQACLFTSGAASAPARLMLAPLSDPVRLSSLRRAAARSVDSESRTREFHAALARAAPGRAASAYAPARSQDI